MSNVATLWYGMWVKSGSESKFVEALKIALIEKGMIDSLIDVVIPSAAEKERFAQTSNKGKKRFAPVFNCYVFLCVEKDSECLEVAQNIPGFMAFVGNGRGTPIRIPEHEIKKMVEIGTSSSIGKWQRSYVIGDKVKIVDGPFAALTATVEDIDEERERLKLSVFIFGKSLVIDSGFDGVENI